MTEFTNNSHLSLCRSVQPRHVYTVYTENYNKYFVCIAAVLVFTDWHLMNENKYDVKAKSLPRLIINKPKSYEIALKAAIEITFSSNQSVKQAL